MALWTQADVDTLKAAVVSGVLTVSYAGPPSRTITYQSLSEMRSLLAVMVASVAAAAGTATPFRLAATRKGLGLSGGSDPRMASWWRGGWWW